MRLAWLAQPSWYTMAGANGAGVNGRPMIREWDQAAAAARFGFYELAEPSPDAVWAGGSGCDRNRTVSIEVHASVDGHEVSVETIGPPQGGPLERHLRGRSRRRMHRVHRDRTRQIDPVAVTPLD